jgi:ligand-binding sensor domain-containing protein/signal transduction histidine kinase
LRYYRVIIFLLTYCCVIPLHSQPSNVNFNQITVTDGLSQNSVNYIMEDRFGFMWFGTQDGLNRFDGYDFKTYRHQPGNPNTLSHNFVWCMYEDKDGIIWIGTFGGGVSRLDPAIDIFTHFKNAEGDKNSLSDNRVTSIVEYPEGTLWIGTDDGINKLDKKTGKIKRYLTRGSDNGSKKILNRISFINALPGDELWMISDSGLTSLDTKSEEIKFYSSAPFDEKLSLEGVLGITNENNALLVSCRIGVVKIDFDSRTSSLVLYNKSSGENSLTYFFAYPDKGDHYWISTDKGLLLFDKHSGISSLYESSSTNLKGITHNNIISIYRNKAGVIWIGTRNGLNRVDRVKDDFGLIKYDANSNNTLASINIGAFIEDRKGRLWIGSQEGMTLYEPEREKFTIYTHIPGNPSSLSSDYLLSMLEDSKGNIWIGTRNGGLNKVLIPENGEPENVKFENYSNGGPASIHSIYEDKEGKLWIGSAAGGLYNFDPASRKFEEYPYNLDGSGPSHPYIYCIEEDSEGNFWLGTANGGLNLFDRKTKRFCYIRNLEDDPKSLSADMVLSIFEDKEGYLWVGTSGRLNRLEARIEDNMFEKFTSGELQPEFTSFGTQEGLPNEVIYGILDDEQGNLWMSTNKGIAKFDPRSEKVLKVYDALDGLQNDEFNQNCYFKNSTGKMYFGGIEGLNVFYPDSIKGNLTQPPVVITNFSLFNESVPVNDKENFSLEKNVRYLDEIDLDYDHGVISFEYASLNFTNPEKNEYAYKMEGFDNDWIYAGDRRQVTYTNLDPGTYTFRVKASNNDGVWNEEGASVILNIPPPPWMSWYAYLAYAILLIMMILFVIRVRVASVRREIEQKANIEMAKVQEREIVRKKSSADFHDEAGNKITKISLLTELAKREVNGHHGLEEYLAKIEENTKELSSGMRDFIWVLDPAKDSLLDTVQRLKAFGNSMFDYTDTEFTVTGISEKLDNIPLSMDSRRALMLIFKEAMNNIVKYAKARSVVLDIAADGEMIAITMTDDGCGFDPGSNVSGYGLSNMKERAKKIGGAIEIISSPDSGTKISFTSNITQMSN